MTIVVIALGVGAVSPHSAVAAELVASTPEPECADVCEIDLGPLDQDYGQYYSISDDPNLMVMVYIAEDDTYLGPMNQGQALRYIDAEPEYFVEGTEEYKQALKLRLAQVVSLVLTELDVELN
ncbi:MAG: hypothetical protein V4436_00700 [Patescibacteria group bacterium]